MIVKKLDGDDLLDRWTKNKPPLATCQAELSKAADLVSTAQQILASKAGFIQGDESFQNVRFLHVLTHDSHTHSYALVSHGI